MVFRSSWGLCLCVTRSSSSVALSIFGRFIVAWRVASPWYGANMPSHISKQLLRWKDHEFPRYFLMAACALFTGVSEAKIHRSHSACVEFKHQQPCPGGSVTISGDWK